MAKSKKDFFFHYVTSNKLTSFDRFLPKNGKFSTAAHEFCRKTNCASIKGVYAKGINDWLWLLVISLALCTFTVQITSIINKHIKFFGKTLCSLSMKLNFLKKNFFFPFFRMNNWERKKFLFLCEAQKCSIVTNKNIKPKRHNVILSFLVLLLGFVAGWETRKADQSLSFKGKFWLQFSSLTFSTLSSQIH